MRFACAQCGELADRPAGHVNRSRARGDNLYCSRKCSGLGRRTNKTRAVRVAEKRLYDIRYRQLNATKRKIEKAAYHARTYDPEAAAIKRKQRMPYHVEYCRRPEYKKYKQKYDRKRNEAAYGPAGEHWRLLQDLETEIRKRATKYEIYKANGTLNKKNERARKERPEKERSNRNRDQAT